MSRPRKSVPSYRLHKQSGQAVVILSDTLGNRRDILLEELYGLTAAGDIGPLALKTWRAEMIRKGWSRTCVNAQVGKLCRVFRNRGQSAGQSHERGASASRPRSRRGTGTHRRR